MEDQITPVLLLGCLQANCRAPVISPAGDRVAYERTEVQGYPRVWMMSLNRAEEQGDDAENVQPASVVLAGDPLHQTLLPSWSPDGLLTFYDTQAAAFVLLDPRTGEQALFPNQTGEKGAWNPSGREFVAPEIFFLDSGSLGDLQSYANSHLIQFDRFTRNTQDLTPEEGMEDSSPAFSPDGTYLAFARKYLDQQRWTPGRQLWVMLPGIGQAQPVTDEPNYNHFEFAWSPDSNQLAYVRFNQTTLTMPPEIWVLALLNAESELLVEGGYSPQWIP